MTSSCDTCFKTTKDRAAEQGWIFLRDIAEIIIYLGRNQRGESIRAHRSITGNLEFCSAKCLEGFISELVSFTDG
ncbi:hypothetical protein KAR91_24600 [Candidatus Pacearchaeota archaeon]|nr:hypothetical protein [Candidatus Pacearchaeota archaeon]